MVESGSLICWLNALRVYEYGRALGVLIYSERGHDFKKSMEVLLELGMTQDVHAACANSASSQDLADTALSLVAETFRLQEEKAISAPAELKTLAAWLEQAG